MKIRRLTMGVPLFLLLAAPAAGNAVVRDDYVVHELANKLERRSYKALRRAENRRHHFTRAEDRALRALYDLSRESAYFNDQTRRYRRNRRHLARDFQPLERAFYRAARLMDRAHVDRRVRRDFRKVARAFDDLANHVYAYGGRGQARYERRHDEEHVYYEDGRYEDRDRTRVRGRVDVRDGRVHVDVGVKSDRGRFRVRW